MQTIKVKDVLSTARDFVARGWCQKALARNEDGDELDDVMDQAACSWCPHGALGVAIMTIMQRDGGKVYGEDLGPEDFDNYSDLEDIAEEALARILFPDKETLHYSLDEIVDWNDADGRTQDEVVLALGKAAEWIGDETVTL